MINAIQKNKELLEKGKNRGRRSNRERKEWNKEVLHKRFLNLHKCFQSSLHQCFQA